MGLATTAIVALGVTSAGMQIAAGQVAGRRARYEGEYGAQVYEQQAGMIESQKELEAYQYNRAIVRMRGKGIARTAKAGLELSGSPVAVMIDTETQMQLDKSIGQYNLEVKKRYALSGARYYRYTGREAARAARWQGYTNAFTTLLQTGFTAYSMSASFGGIKPYSYMSKPGYGTTSMPALARARLV